MPLLPVCFQRAPSVPVQLGIPPKPRPFPLFPQPLNIQRTATPAAPFPACAYFTICFGPGAYPSPASASERVRFKASCLATSHSPLTYVESIFIRQPVGIHSKALPQILNPLDATLTKNQGGRDSSGATTAYSDPVRRHVCRAHHLHDLSSSPRIQRPNFKSGAQSRGSHTA